MCSYMRLRWLWVLFLAVFLGGCASLAKKEDLASLETKMNTLENRVEELQKQQNQLLDLQMKMKEDMKYESAEKTEAKEELTEGPSNKDIQTALKNAGFYQGEIDAKIGPQTRSAIMDFQKEKGLEVDGVVGQNTWELLKEFYTSEQKE